MAENRRAAQPGLLRLVTGNDLAGAARIDTGGTSLPSDGTAEMAQTAAAGFAEVGAKIGAIADHAAKVEGADSGRLAGLDPEFRPTKSLTIRGEAYDQAGLQVAGAQMKTHIAADMAEAFEKNQADPAKLAQVLKAKGDAWRMNALPELLPDATHDVEQHTFTLMREATRIHDARLAQEQTAAIQTQLHEGLRGLSQRAYTLGLDPQADEALAADLANLQKKLTATDLRGKRLVDPVAAGKIIEGAKQEVATSRTLGAFDRLPDVDSKAAYIKRFRADFGDGKGTAGAYDFDHFHKVERLLLSELRAARAEDGAAARGLAEEVKGVAKMAEKGRAPAPDEMAGLEARVEALKGSAKDEKLDGQLQDAKVMLEWQRAARRSTPDELDQWLRQEEAKMARDGATPRQGKLVDLGKSLLTNMRTELKQDPLGWADTTGMLKIIPVDASSPTRLAMTLAARLPRADEVAATYHQEAHYLRPDERHRIATLIGQGGETGAAALSAVVAGAGERAPQVMKELSDHFPQVAALGGLATAVGPDAQVVKDAQAGIALKKTPDYKPVAPHPNDMRAAARDVLGTALANAPKDETAVMALANAIYEVRAQRERVTSFDRGLWQQALKEAVGERTIGGEKYGGVVAQSGLIWGGNQIVLPPEVKQSKWRQAIDAITPADLEAAGLGKPAGGDGKPLGVDRLKAATLVQAGSGQYMLATGDTSKPGAEGLVMQGDGKRPFVLDMNRLGPILRQRRPDLFLGGK